MDILTSILIWIGIGIAIGVGICLVIAAAWLLFELYEKFFPKKKQSPFENFQAQLHHAKENCIFLSPDLIFSFDPSEPLKKLRSEFWKKDIVAPIFQIQQIDEAQNFNCFVRIDGKQIFKAKINGGAEAGEKIISEIRKYFLMVEAKNFIEEKRRQK